MRHISRLGISLVAAVTLTTILAAGKAQALTRNWDRPAGLGGLYSTGNHWSPAGVPRAEDDVRFNIFSTEQPQIIFTQDFAATDLLIDHGDIQFGGTNSSTYSLSNATIASGAELAINRVLSDFAVDITNDLDVFGDLLVLDGSRLTVDTVDVDSTNDATSALFRLAGTNSAGESSSAQISNLRIGSAHQGRVSVEDGAVLQSEFLNLLTGDLVVSGVGPGGNPSTIITDHSALIGANRAGNVEILDGAHFSSQGASLGFIAVTSVGSVLVDGKDNLGNPSRWDVNGTLTVNKGGITVSDGAELTSGKTNLMGEQIDVKDVGSSWTTTELLDIETASLRIGNGAHVSSEVTNVEKNSQLFIEGGSNPNIVAEWTNSGNVFVAGTEFGSSTGTGSFETSGFARTEIGGTLKIWGSGSGSVGTSSTLVADRIENSEGGEFDFLGGTLQVSQFDGHLVNQGGTLSPGGPDAGGTTVFGNYTQQGAGTLALDLGGNSPGGTHDLVTVTGDALIDGQLELSLFDSFTPEASDTFPVFSSDSLFGFFDNVNTGQRLDTSDGLGSFVVNYGIGSAFDNSQIVLSDFVPVPVDGDYDFDGDTDGFDFLLWQRGESPDPLSGLDFIRWRFNFGNSANPLAAASHAVPEPATYGLILTAVAIRLCQRRCLKG